MENQKVFPDVNRMKLFKLALLLRGYGTLEYIKLRTGVDDKKAIYLVHRLRKGGYVKTKYLSNKRRVYDIGSENLVGGESYIEVLNRYAPNKLADYRQLVVHGRKLSAEETLIYAMGNGSVRQIIACLALFSKIKNWSKLYQGAKKMNLVRQVAALYDVARLVVPKVRRMPKRFRNLALPRKGDKYKYIIKGYNSDHFQNIEDKWRVYIPLNWGDIQEYKGVFT